jgi:hypothetical protein
MKPVLQTSPHTNLYILVATNRSISMTALLDEDQLAVAIATTTSIFNTSFDAFCAMAWSNTSFGTIREVFDFIAMGEDMN